MFYQTDANGKIIGRTNISGIPGLTEGEDGHSNGEYLINGKFYTPPNTYSLPPTISADGTATWEDDISSLKETFLDAVDTITSTIIYNTYPAYAQQNLNSDCTYAINVIAIELGISTETIYGNVYKFIGSDLSHDTLLTMKNNISTVDLSSLLNGISVDISGITNAYRTVLYSTLSYKLMKFIRDWCNAKKKVINNSKTVDQLNEITFDDYPTLA